MHPNIFSREILHRACTAHIKLNRVKIKQRKPVDPKCENLRRQRNQSQRTNQSLRRFSTSEQLLPRCIPDQTHFQLILQQSDSDEDWVEFCDAPAAPVKTSVHFAASGALDRCSCLVLRHRIFSRRSIAFEHGYQACGSTCKKGKTSKGECLRCVDTETSLEMFFALISASCIC